VHSRYRRTLADAPIGARAVVIELRVRGTGRKYKKCSGHPNVTRTAS
jgi:hypothetical protein